MDVLPLNKKLSIGDIIWGKLGSYKWWPSIIINSADIGLPDTKFGSVWVFWFGDYKVSQLSRKKIVSFTLTFNHMYSKDAGKCLQAATIEALEVIAIRLNYRQVCQTDLLSWAKEGFKTSGEILLQNKDIPLFVVKQLERIQNLNKKLTDHNVVTEKIFNSNEKLRQVKEGFLKLQDVCIACFGSDVEVVDYHPLFEGGLCLKCKEQLKETIFAFGNDGKNVCCAICAEPGSLILCDDINCSRSYCLDCVGSLLGEEARQQIVQTTPWFCFFCQKPNSNEYSLLQIKFDWEKRLQALFQPSNTFVDETSLLYPKTKEPIKVLSLFDGISTGKVALDCLGMEIDKYYASEINEDAMNVSKFHHLHSIIHIGDITNLTEAKIQSICPVDLVIGGSPCNELSLVNPIRKGIYDFSGTGPLFFDYFHVLKTVEKLNGKRHLFFLFENVAAMRHIDKSVITTFLMTEPVLVDAKSVSPQSRPRYFWGNIPGMSHNFCAASQGDSLNDDGFESDKLLSHCLLEGFGRKAMVDKIKTVTTNMNSLIQDGSNLLPVEMNGQPDILWVTELEKIFGLPRHYTDTGYLNINKRRELLGKSWSVPVITNILRPLLNFFKKKDSVQ